MSIFSATAGPQPNFYANQSASFTNTGSSQNANPQPQHNTKPVRFSFLLFFWLYHTLCMHKLPCVSRPRFGLPLSLLELWLLMISLPPLLPRTGLKQLQHLSTGKTHSTDRRPERICLVPLKIPFSLRLHLDVRTSTTTHSIYMTEVPPNSGPNPATWQITPRLTCSKEILAIRFSLFQAPNTGRSLP